MKEYYTLQEMQLFPGLSGAVVKRLCEDLGIEREKKLLRGAKSSYVLTRPQFEQILQKAGWEKVIINDKEYWVRFKIEDF